MRVAILSDAHGNFYAFNKCLDYIISNYKVDSFFYLGDAVGYFPDGNSIIESLAKVSAECILGNHEAMLLGYLKYEEEKESIYLLESTKKDMSEKNLSMIRKWVPFIEKKMFNKKLLFVHGSPWDPLNGYVYPDYQMEMFKNLNYDVIFMGHTHRPFLSRVDNKLIVNVGSCGLPRDQGNLLSFAIYDVAKNECEIYRIQINTEDLLQIYPNIDVIVKKCLNRESVRIFGRLVGENNE